MFGKLPADVHFQLIAADVRNEFEGNERWQDDIVEESMRTVVSERFQRLDRF